MIFVKHSDIVRYCVDIVMFCGSIGWTEVQNGPLLEKCWKTTGFGL